jgi:hypothetical protein
MKQDFSNAITILESKLATTRSSLAKEKETQEEMQKRLEESLQENLTLTLTLKSRQKELEEALQGNKYTILPWIIIVTIIQASCHCHNS